MTTIFIPESLYHTGLIAKKIVLHIVSTRSIQHIAYGLYENTRLTQIDNTSITQHITSASKHTPQTLTHLHPYLLLHT